MYVGNVKDSGVWLVDPATNDGKCLNNAGFIYFAVIIMWKLVWLFRYGPQKWKK